jgi:predicted RNA-binding Zn-ribbon protein involved in translation (DUF1610 family)
MGWVLLVSTIFVCGFFLIAKSRTMCYDKEDEATIHVNHLKPVYYGYWTYRKGGYTNLSACTSCGLVGLYEDFHPTNPCFKCGGKVISRIGKYPFDEPFVGRWAGKYWEDASGKEIRFEIKND